MEGIVGVIAIYMAMKTVLVRTPISAVIYLVGAVIGIAVIWMLNGIGVMGVIYTIVYIGGIVVLFVFVIMMVESPLDRNKMDKQLIVLMGVLVLITLNEGEGEGRMEGEKGGEVVRREVMETIGGVIYSEYQGLIMVGMILLVVMVGLRRLIQPGDRTK